MTAAKISGVARHILTFAGGFAVAKGWIDEGAMLELTGALSMIIGTLWSVFAPEKKSN